MKKSIFIVLMAFFLNIVLGQLSFATCYRFYTNCSCGACSINGQTTFGGPYNCVLPEELCPSTQYCVANYIPGYSGCFNCPTNNPNCNATTSVERTPQNITQTKDPVDIFSGEAYFSSTDFSLSGRGPKLALFRKYRSFSTFIGMFGYGWRTDFDINLTQDSYGDVTIYDADGTQISFTNNSGSYINSPGNFSTLKENSDYTYTLTDKYGIV